MHTRRPNQLDIDIGSRRYYGQVSSHRTRETLKPNMVLTQNIRRFRATQRGGPEDHHGRDIVRGGGGGGGKGANASSVETQNVGGIRVSTVETQHGRHLSVTAEIHNVGVSRSAR